MDAEPWLPLPQAAVALGLSVETARKRAQRGQLTARKSDGVWWVYVGAETPETTTDLVVPRRERQETSAELVAQLQALVEQLRAPWPGPPADYVPPAPARTRGRPRSLGQRLRAALIAALRS